MKIKALLGTALAVFAINAFADDSIDTTSNPSTDSSSATQVVHPKKAHKKKHKHKRTSKKKIKKTVEPSTSSDSSTSTDANTDAQAN